MPRQWSLLKRISLLTLSKALERSTEWRIKVAFSLSRSTSISWVMESRAPMWGMAASHVATCGGFHCRGG